MEYGSCHSCERTLRLPFYMCSNWHLTCIFCYRQKYIGNDCPLCGAGRLMCFNLEEYDSLLSRMPVFTSTGGLGALVLMSTKNACLPYTRLYSPYGPKQESRMMQCPSCRKCLSSARVMEHFDYEHHSTPVVPVLPGSIVASTLRLEDIKENQILCVQALRLRENLNSANDGFEKEDKLLYILACWIPLLAAGRDRAGVRAVALWLSPSFNLCVLNYTIEARSDKGTIASLIFTGPVLAKDITQDIMQGSKGVETMGTFLCVKKPLADILNSDGKGIIIKVMIHDEITSLNTKGQAQKPKNNRTIPPQITNMVYRKNNSS